MSGVGRKTQYRKHLTDALLNDFPVPDFIGGERIARIYSCRGGNQFEILVADPPQTQPTLSSTENNSFAHDENECLRGERMHQLAMLPKKYHKLVWIKRKDFVIVRGCLEGAGVSKVENSNGIRYIITQVLYKDQVKHLKQEGFWPLTDVLFTELSSEQIEDNQTLPTTSMCYTAISPCDGLGRREHTDISDDEKSYDDTNTDDEHDEYLINTNRLAKIRLEDSSEDESSDDL